jgi:DNA-binding SARP family transcriptional activator/TolB-like protein
MTGLARAARPASASAHGFSALPHLPTIAILGFPQQHRKYHPSALMQLRLTTLGAVRVHRDATEVPDLPAQRLRFALLLYLAAERDVSREEVVAMFWPDRDMARGKHALRQMLYELRQSLGEGWIELRKDRIVAFAAVDAAEFEEAAANGRSGEALKLYGGPFLQGFTLDNRTFEGWADRRRAHLARVHRRLQREHIARLVEDGRTDDAMAAARGWVELDPLDDEAVHTLIERLAGAGQRTAALQYFDNYVRQLQAELQVDPLEETSALVAAIRSGETGAMAGTRIPAPESAPLRPPGKPSPGASPEPPPRGSPPQESGESAPWRSESGASAPWVPASGEPSPATRRPGAGPSASGGPAAPRRTLGPTVRSRAFVVSAAVVVAMVAVVLLFDPFDVMDRGRGMRVADRSVSIAVLPFNDYSSGSSLEPLTDALTEALAHGLAQSRLLDVISPNGVLLLRAQGTPEDSLGRMLGADYLVGGSIRQDGDQVRLDVELLDGRTGTVIRTAVVDRPWAESRILVEDVVRGAATFLRREVGLEIETERVRAHTTSEGAWRAVLEARSLQAPIADLLRAREYEAAQRALSRSDSVLQIAADLDRRWAEPVVLRGWVLEDRAFIARAAGQPVDTTSVELLEAGLRMADQAAARDADDPGVHALRGALLYQLALLDGLPADSAYSLLRRAEVELVRATDLDPVSQSSWRRLAAVLYATERYGEARVAVERAYRRDYYAPETNTLLTLLFATSIEVGDDVQAEGWCLEGRRRYPDELPFLYCLHALHAWADGVEADPAVLHRAIELFPHPFVREQPQLSARLESMLASAYARADQPDSARAVLSRVARVSGDDGLLWLRASAHAALGEDEAAIRLLGTYLERAGWQGSRVARSRPFWRLRDHPEIQRLTGSALADR